MNKQLQKPTCLDFFAGSGLVIEGLKDYFCTIWANDICSKKGEVFCANHNKNIFHLGPIENISGCKVPYATLSWGSFPCQDLSLAGNMGGLLSSRSGLVWQWFRVMDEQISKTPLVVAENVVGLISSAKGENYRQLHDALVERGYKIGVVLLDAIWWIPQSRKRIFVIAVDKQIDIDHLEINEPTWCHSDAIVKVSKGLKNWVWWNLPKPKVQKKRLDDIIDYNAQCDPPKKRDYLLSLIPEKHKEKLASAVKNGQRVFPGYKRIRNGMQVLELRFDGVAGCLRTPTGGSSRQYLIIADNNCFKTRLLTINETAALMGVRKTYKIPGTYNAGYKAMGDAVAVPVSRYLAKTILAPLSQKIKESAYAIS